MELQSGTSGASKLLEPQDHTDGAIKLLELQDHISGAAKLREPQDCTSGAVKLLEPQDHTSGAVKLQEPQDCTSGAVKLRELQNVGSVELYSHRSHRKAFGAAGLYHWSRKASGAVKRGEHGAVQQPELSSKATEATELLGAVELQDQVGED